MYTVQQVLDAARLPLNDSDKLRYSDATLLTYFNDAIVLLYRIRPDLFVGNWSVFPPFRMFESTDDFPLSAAMKPYVSDYITGRAELVDDEYTENGRATMLISSLLNNAKR